MSKVGIVIPTIFERPEYLFESIKSIRAAGNAYILLSAPDSDLKAPYLALVDEFKTELQDGNLSAKINHALNQLPSDCEFIGWLGDDDLLTPKSLERASQALQDNPDVGLVYGSCDYIDKHGNKIGQNPSGEWAKKLMAFGPFLIPQPGSLWRKESFNAIGGIDDQFALAFDHDLFLRLSRHSGAMFIGETQAAFRWHSGSLSVGRRWQSVSEASRVRKKHYSKGSFLPKILWEFLVVTATFAAGKIVSLLTRR